MNKTYKIAPDKIKSIAINDIRGAALLILGTTLFVFVSVYMMFTFGKDARPIKNIIPIVLFSFSCMMVMCALILWFVYSFKVLFYKKYTIQISDTEIRKYIDITYQLNSSLLKKLLWGRIKRISPQTDITLKLNEINKLKESRHGFTLKIANANTFTGEGQISLPKQLDGYDELKHFFTGLIK